MAVERETCPRCGNANVVGYTQCLACGHLPVIVRSPVERTATNDQKAAVKYLQMFGRALSKRKRAQQAEALLYLKGDLKK